MRDTAGALYGFFSGFGLPAFVKGRVPEETPLPYITYELREPEPGGQCSLDAFVWYKGTGYAAITQKVDEIKDAVTGPGRRGARLNAGDGVITIYLEKLFCQHLETDEPDVKYAYLRFIMCAYKL